MDEPWSFEKKCGLCGAPISLHMPGGEVVKKCMALFESKFGLGAALGSIIQKKKGGAFKMGDFQKSLNPASDTKYIPARVRVTEPGTLKFQGEGNMELSVQVDAKITTWVQGRDHSLESMVGTGVKYAPCQMVAHDKADPKVAEFGGPVRIQMKGPALNRDWGVEFVVDNGKLRNWAEQYHKFLSTEKSNQATGKLVEDEPKEGEG